MSSGLTGHRTTGLGADGVRTRSGGDGARARSTLHKCSLNQEHRGECLLSLRLEHSGVETQSMA